MKKYIYIGLGIFIIALYTVEFIWINSIQKKFNEATVIINNQGAALTQIINLINKANSGK